MFYVMSESNPLWRMLLNILIDFVADGETNGTAGHPGGGDPLPQGHGQVVRGQAQGEPAGKVASFPQEATGKQGWLIGM